MQAERRATVRLPIVDEVMVTQGQHYRLCHTRDLSLHGALLDIGWGALTRYTPIELLLTLADGDEKGVYRIPAEVTRISATGTAIRFQRLEAKVNSVLSGRLLSGLLEQDRMA
jgi:hypothetical protein